MISEKVPLSPRVAHTLPFMYATQSVGLRPLAPVVQGRRSIANEVIDSVR